jgi:glucose-1-phosphate thymidylyltransferase
MRAKGIVMLERAQPAAGRTGDGGVPALEDVANRPIVHHVLDALLEARVEDVIVAGAADAIIDAEACLRRYRRGSMRLEYAVFGPDLDLVDRLRAAAPFVGDEPCVVHLADGLLGDKLVPYLKGATARSTDLTVLAARGGRSRAGRPSHAHDVRLGLGHRVGVGLFGPRVLSQVCDAAGGEFLSDLHVLADQLRTLGGRVEIRPVEEWRRYAGNPRDLLDLNRLALDGMRASVIPINAQGNQIEGRVQIDPTATVTSSVIFGPAVIGPKARVVDAYIGPYTSIGSGATIEGAEIERSIISPDASIQHVGERIVSSLVGRGARVFRDFSVPRAMRLQVSACDEVALC